MYKRQVLYHSQLVKTITAVLYHSQLVKTIIAVLYHSQLVKTISELLQCCTIPNLSRQSLQCCTIPNLSRQLLQCCTIPNLSRQLLQCCTTPNLSRQLVITAVLYHSQFVKTITVNYPLPTVPLWPDYVMQEGLSLLPLKIQHPRCIQQYLADKVAITIKGSVTMYLCAVSYTHLTLPTKVNV